MAATYPLGLVLAFVGLWSVVSGVRAHPAGTQDGGPVETRHARAVPRGLDLHMPVPDDNPVNAAKVALGRRLFSDPQLSSDRSIACVTCHDPRRAFTDGRAVARGVRRGQAGRNVPTIVNRGYGKAFSWDGRSTTLEEQVLAPVTSPREMGANIAMVLERLSNDDSYRLAFEAAFDDGLSERSLAYALASFVRSVRSGNSPVDRYLDREVNALTPEARLGLRVFVGKANCWLCHAGATFTDEKFHNTGVAWDGGRFRDIGRARVTGDPGDEGAFKTPTLRDVARTAPYMHDGSLKRLEDVVEFYSRGGRPNPRLDALIGPLELSREEKRGLVAFLHALTGRIEE
jgi:cytochrome c peroxidase